MEVLRDTHKQTDELGKMVVNGIGHLVQSRSGMLQSTKKTILKKSIVILCSSKISNDLIGGTRSSSHPSQGI